MCKANKLNNFNFQYCRVSVLFSDSINIPLPPLLRTALIMVYIPQRKLTMVIIKCGIRVYHFEPPTQGLYKQVKGLFISIVYGHKSTGVLAIFSPWLPIKERYNYGLHFQIYILYNTAQLVPCPLLINPCPDMDLILLESVLEEYPLDSTRYCSTILSIIQIRLRKVPSHTIHILVESSRKK